jgi:cell division initiation protein
MKITPLEIRQKQFEKKTFGGIDKDEVQAFLNSLSIAWEKNMEDQATLRARLEASEKEVQKLREVESSLYKTLKTAEDTSQKAIDQANQQAKLIVQEAKLQAETLNREAKWKASKAMEQAEDYARKSYEQMVQEVKVLEKELRNIENLKDSFLSDIKIIAQDLLEKAERANQRSANIKFSVPPPPQLEMERPLFEEPLVADALVELEVPENQQSIIFETSEKVRKEPEPESLKTQGSAQTNQKDSPKAEPAPAAGGSFFDSIK